MLVITALARSAAESGSLPPEVKAVLQLNVGQVAGKLGAEAQKHIAGAIPGAKVLEGELGGILGGKTAQPPAAGRAGTPAKR
jgi:hypothetical protein